MLHNGKAALLLSILLFQDGYYSQQVVNIIIGIHVRPMSIVSVHHLFRVCGLSAADRGCQRFRRTDGVELYGGVGFQPPGLGRRGEDE